MRAQRDRCRRGPRAGALRGRAGIRWRRGGCAAATGRGPAAREARPEIVAYDLDWEPAVGRRCEARFLASKASKLQLWQCHWHPGVVTAVAKDARPPYCSVKYDDGDAESRVRFEFVRERAQGLFTAFLLVSTAIFQRLGVT